VTLSLRAAASPGEVRIALTAAGGALRDYALWRPGAPDGIGDVHGGRVIARVSTMAGVFVALAAGVEGFLPDTAGGAGLEAGALIAVRITRAAQGGKGPRLARLDPAPAGLTRVGLWQPGPSPLAELAQRYPDAPILTDDPALAAALRGDFGARIARVATAFDAALEEQVAALAEPVVTLANGVRAHFCPTPALTAIDLDAGAATAGRGEKKTVQAALNRALVPALARQMRLRNLAGAILVDFAGMKARSRASLAPLLAAALAEDPLKPRLLGFTSLGFAEILRPRVRPPLHELLRGPHAAGLAALRALLAAISEAPGHSQRLIASPAVAAALAADRVASEDFTRRTGHALALTSDPSLPLEGWRLG
jgi:hypothetical protein